MKSLYLELQNTTRSTTPFLIVFKPKNRSMHRLWAHTHTCSSLRTVRGGGPHHIHHGCLEEVQKAGREPELLDNSEFHSLSLRTSIYWWPVTHSGPGLGDTAAGKSRPQSCVHRTHILRKKTPAMNGTGAGEE